MLDFALARHVDDHVKDGYDASDSLASHLTENPQLQISYSELLAWGQTLPVWLFWRGYIFLSSAQTYPDLLYFSAHTARALASMIYKVRPTPLLRIYLETSD